MSELLQDIGNLWDISLDVLGFYHRCCYNCQPRENGEYVWLSEQYDLGEELESVLIRVCEINNHEQRTIISGKTLEDSLRERPFVCPNCGTEHLDVGNEIGGEWLLAAGEDTKTATYLLTRTYWPYLTHYTKSDARYPDGLSRLANIINDGVIRGSLNMIEGGRPAVCFTECSPVEIYEMLRIMELANGELPNQPRGFEWKRSRHGIAIERDALIDHGARPVIHAEAEIKERLGEDILWRFKQFNPRNAQFDWTFEREFRIAGDVQLNSFAPCQIMLLVKDRNEQFRLLASRSVPKYAIVPFDYVFSTDNPKPHISARQRLMQGDGEF